MTSIYPVSRKGSHSIRINKRWRICFVWHDGDAHDVEIVDYHRGVKMGTEEKLDPIHPGEILLEDFMKPMGISINRLARDLDVPPGRISEIVNGKRSVTADTALRLGKFFGVSPETWVGLQADYDLRVARRAVGPEIEERVREHVA